MKENWHTLFFGGPFLPLWGYFVRTTLLYWLVVFVTRIAGKRQVGVLSGYNYIIIAGVIAISGSRMMNPEYGVVDAAFVILIFTLINLFLSYLSIKWPKWIEKSPILLIEDGRILKKNLLKGRISIDELLEQLRFQGIYRLSQVAYANLEPNGKISVRVKKMESLPVEQNSFLPHILIYDGEVDQSKLDRLGLDLPWLNKKLLQKGISDIQAVFLAVLEDNGTLYISTGE